MNQEYVLLLDKEEMWARMLTQLLDDNGIPYVTVLVYGTGMVLKTVTQERLRVFVDRKNFLQVSDLAEALFSAEIVEEDWQQ